MLEIKPVNTTLYVVSSEIGLAFPIILLLTFKLSGKLSFAGVNDDEIV